MKSCFLGICYLNPPHLPQTALTFRWLGGQIRLSLPSFSQVNRHIRRQVYCAAVRRLGSPASAFLGDRAPRTALPQEADAIAHGMSCLGDKSEEEVAATMLDPILKHPDVPVKRVSWS